MNKIQELIEQILNFEAPLVSVKTQNNFYFKIKELIEFNFQEEEARKNAYLEDLEHYHNEKYEIHIGGVTSKRVRHHSRNIYHFAQLLAKIKFNMEIDHLIGKYLKNNRIEKDLLDCYKAISNLCSLKFTLPSEEYHKHRSEIEILIKLLKYNDEKLVKKLGIHFTCKLRPDVWKINTGYEITINKLYLHISMIGDYPYFIQMNLEDRAIIDLLDILDFLDSIKQKLLENRLKKEVNPNQIIFKLFPKYKDIPTVNVNDKELQRLYQINDQEIRLKLKKILINNKRIPELIRLRLEQEAKKPHTAFEVSDFEFPIEIENKLFYICLVIKSGKEIIGKTVSIQKVFYQLDRPFKEYRTKNPIVIFFTAKACSQPLMNEIKKYYSTFPKYIEVIEKENFVKLLKIYDLF